MELKKAFKKKFGYVENINYNDIKIISFKKLSSDSDYAIANWDHDGAEEYLVETDGNSFHMLVCESDIHALSDDARCEDVDDYITIVYDDMHMI